MRAQRETETVARRLGWYTLYCFLLAPLVVGRFELAPMVLAFAAARWWFSGRASPRRNHRGPGHAFEDSSPGRGGAGPGLGSRVGSDHEGPREKVAFLATLAVGLPLVLAGGVASSNRWATIPERPRDRVALRRSVIPRGTIARKTPWVFDHNAYHVSSEWGARLAFANVSRPGDALLVVMEAFRRSGMADDRFFGSRRARLHHLRQGLVAPVPDLVVSRSWPCWTAPRAGARKIFLLGCVITLLLYPGPGFGMVLDAPGRGDLAPESSECALVWLFAMLVYCPREDLCSEMHPAGVEGDARPSSSFSLAGPPRVL